MKTADIFAARLDALMREAGVSNYRLAKDSGVSAQQIGRLRRGEQQPSWDAVCRIADALKVSTEAFRASLTR